MEEATAPEEADDSRSGWRWSRGRVAALVLLLPLVALVVAATVLWTTTEVPAPESVQNAQVSVLRYSDGAVLARTGVENRTSVPLEQMSLAARQAVLAAEDREFYQSAGISPRGILRAAWVNLRSGEVEQGGSTITQQYARNAFLSQERTLTRKLRETVLALKLDRSRSKDELLERYLNTVYFGRGAYGIEAAARTYFGTSAAELSASQGAVLASLLRSPSGYDPAEHPERARDRWQYVLRGMVEQGWLSTPVAAQEYPQVRPPQSENSLGGAEGYLVKTAMEELAELGFSEDVVNVRGLQIETTFDRQMQGHAERAMNELTDPAEGIYRAVVSVEPGTGRVRAMYGGDDFVSRPFNAVTQGSAQAGSSFKPYVLAAALRKGISLRSRFDGSSPQRFGDYEVKNFGRGDGADYGRIDLLTATANSVNTVYVPLGLKVGPGAVADTARDLGITADMGEERSLPSISLGVTAVTPLEQATAYATLAAGGVRAEPFVVERVVDRSGTPVYEASAEGERVLDADVAADVTYALRQVVERGSGAAADLPARPAAGKTGTTTGNTAAWFVGYTPRLATAVALFTDRSDRALPPMSGVQEVTGGSLPARVWGSYTRAALEGLPALAFPEPAFTGERLASPTPTPTPSPSPAEAKDEPEQEPTREQQPSPAEATQASSPSPSREPSREPPPSEEPSPSEQPTPPPTQDPEPTPPPTEDPEPTPPPSEEPTPPPTEDPEPTPPPTEDPDPTPPPSEDPDPTPPPSEEPTPPPTQDPEPEPTDSPVAPTEPPATLDAEPSGS